MKKDEVIATRKNKKKPKLLHLAKWETEVEIR